MRISRLTHAFFVLLPCASAADYTVPAGGSIQALIDITIDGDRVLVPPGTYVEQLDFGGKAIVVLGLEGAELTILDANYAGPAVRLTNGEGPDSILRGLTVTHGSGGTGPGGVVTNGTPTLEDCIIKSNVGRLGAGVHGDATLVRCRIENNTSSLNHGGGLYGAPTLIECVVMGNTCTGSKGGGLYVTGGNATLIDCQILANSAVLAGSRGGGVYVASSGTLLLERCVIAENRCSGGVFGSFGGGVWADGATTLSHCTVTRNHLLTGNLMAGGVYGPGATIVNSIVRDNDAEEISGAASVTWSNVEGGAAGLANIDADPQFFDALGGDYHLQAGSPSIDAGDPASAPDPDGSTADQGAYPFDPAYTAAPSNYCTSTMNSSGAAATIDWTGSYGVAANDLVLTTEDCPAGNIGLFYWGAGAVQLPFYGGFRCVGGGGTLYRLPLSVTEADGTVQQPYDNGASAAGAPTAGETRRFQFWFRDAADPTGANLSDGLAVMFAP